MDKIFIALLAKTLNLSTESVAELLYKKSDDGKLTTDLNEGVLEELLALDAARVEKLKGNGKTKESFDNGYKKGQKEALTKLEKELKAEYDLETESTGLELVKELQQKFVKANDLTDEKVKVHPAFLALEKAKKEEIEALKTEHETALNGIEAEQLRKGVLSKVYEKAEEVLNGLNPIISQNGTVATNIKKTFLKDFEQYGYKENEGEILVLKADGSRLEDKHGNPISLTNLVTNTASGFYEFKKQSDKGNGGNGNEGGEGGFKFKVPTNEEEFNTALNNATSSDQRLAIAKAYEESQK